MAHMSSMGALPGCCFRPDKSLLRPDAAPAGPVTVQDDAGLVSATAVVVTAGSARPACGRTTLVRADKLWGAAPLRRSREPSGVRHQTRNGLRAALDAQGPVDGSEVDLHGTLGHVKDAGDFLRG